MAIHERIVGPLLRRLSISKRHSQCSARPSFQPAMARATSSCDIRRNSSEYAIDLSPQSLATYEAQAEAYRELFEMGEGYPGNLTDEAYLICEVVPALIEKVRLSRGEATHD